jgi:hypothetical protein
MRCACWITKATNPHSDCVIIISFPLQQSLRERALVLCHMYIASLVIFQVDIPVFFKGSYAI